MVRDTVSSVGFGRRDIRLSASSAAAHACHIRHALALDECRVKFIPEYFLEMNLPYLPNSTKDDHPKPSDTEGTNGNQSGRANGPEPMIDHRNTLTSDGSWNTSNNDTILEDRDGPTAEEAQLALANGITYSRPSSEETARKIADIKEVWFAGSHSDVYVHVDLVVSSKSNFLQRREESTGKDTPRRKCVAYVDASRSV